MLVAALFFVLVSSPQPERSWIDEYPVEAAAVGKAREAKDYAEARKHLLRLGEILSGRGDMVYALATVEAARGDHAAALEGLTRFSRMGLTFADPEASPEWAAFKDDAVFREAVARLRAAGQPVTASQPFLTLPQKDMIAEDLAFDPVRNRFYVSSVRHGKIVSVARDGAVADFAAEGEPDIWAILALHVDAKRRLLWATTAAMPEFAGYRAADAGRTALLKYSLDSGALVQRFDLPAGEKHVLGDMTLSDAGDVYVSDGYGAVYQVDHRAGKLELLTGPGTFRSPQTPALSPDGRRLFVADYSRGISEVDLATRHVRLLEHAATLSLAGIDGLYLRGRTMLATQNGTAPPRILRLRLDAGLTRIESGEVVEANWDGLGTPTHGVTVGREFYFLVNAGWDKMADDGSVKAGATFTAPAIRRMPVAGGSKESPSGRYVPE